jgi:hypothetical protein
MTDEELMKRLRDTCRGGETCKCSLNEAADRIEALTHKLAQATWMLTEAAVQLEEGKIKTRRNRAAIIWNLLDEMKDYEDAP